LMTLADAPTFSNPVTAADTQEADNPSDLGVLVKTTTFITIHSFSFIKIS
jgi:hypothetical protein